MTALTPTAMMTRGMQPEVTQTLGEFTYCFIEKSKQIVGNGKECAELQQCCQDMPNHEGKCCTVSRRGARLKLARTLGAILFKIGQVLKGKQYLTC